MSHGELLRKPQPGSGARQRQSLSRSQTASQPFRFGRIERAGTVPIQRGQPSSRAGTSPPRARGKKASSSREEMARATLDEWLERNPEVVEEAEGPTAMQRLRGAVRLVMVTSTLSKLQQTKAEVFTPFSERRSSLRRGSVGGDSSRRGSVSRRCSVSRRGSVQALPAVRRRSSVSSLAARQAAGEDEGEDELEEGMGEFDERAGAEEARVNFDFDAFTSGGDAEASPIFTRQQPLISVFPADTASRPVPSANGVDMAAAMLNGRRLRSDEPALAALAPEWWSMPREVATAAEEFDRRYRTISRRSAIAMEEYARDPSSRLKLEVVDSLIAETRCDRPAALLPCCPAAMLPCCPAALLPCCPVDSLIA